MRIFVLNFSKFKSRFFFGLCSVLLTVAIAVSALTIRRYYAFYDATEASAGVTGTVFVIDAGHGGEDPGAVGVNSVFEKDLNLSVATLIGEELQAKGYTVIFTRTEDKLLYSEEQNVKGMRKIYDLKNRCAIANSYSDAVLVSIHMNSFADSKYSGLQVYYRDDDPDSYMLGNYVQTAVRDSLQSDNHRTVKNGKDLYLLKNCKSRAIIIECGFLTNAEECEKLSQKDYQKKLSFAVVCGIIEYVENKNK